MCGPADFPFPHMTKDDSAAPSLFSGMPRRPPGTRVLPTPLVPNTLVALPRALLPEDPKNPVGAGASWGSRKGLATTRGALRGEPMRRKSGRGDGRGDGVEMSSTPQFSTVSECTGVGYVACAFQYMILGAGFCHLDARLSRDPPAHIAGC